MARVAYAKLVNLQSKRHAFEITRQAIGYRVLQLLMLPLDTLSNTELQAKLERISQS